jgi:hypothetical protein
MSTLIQQILNRIFAVSIVLFYAALTACSRNYIQIFTPTPTPVPSADVSTFVKSECDSRTGSREVEVSLTNTTGPVWLLLADGPGRISGVVSEGRVEGDQSFTLNLLPGTYVVLAVHRPDTGTPQEIYEQGQTLDSSAFLITCP